MRTVSFAEAEPRAMAEKADAWWRGMVAGRIVAVLEWAEVENLFELRPAAG